ncbi:hypothetical protein LCGC14_0349580 [marine sediment metagenome]|uniref:Carbohydrate kinase PfkB domain-containing protein n=1 Tax=marine sediment metagenome TaxID=412755 RepID=A0A0F9VYE3_9ZZZZ
MRFLDQFPYTAEDIIERLEGLKGLKVLVIGDAIIDQYHYSSSIGKSPKDNVMVVRYLSEESFAGGVLAAANHIAGFCDDVHLVTCLGMQNTQERFIRNHLKKNITPKFFYREDTYTAVKRRYIEPNSLTKMFGVSYLDDYDLPESISRSVSSYLWANIIDYDLVLVTDFGHGFLDRNTIKALCEGGSFITVNTQTNTDNAGFNLISKYHKADYICLDEPETRLAFQDKYGDIKSMVKKLECDKVAITHGRYDTVMYDGSFYKIPTFTNGIKDTTGAGDAFFSITAPCVQAGFPMDMVGFIGNAVGALKVGIVCNRSSVEPEPLFKFIKELLK